MTRASRQPKAANFRTRTLEGGEQELLLDVPEEYLGGRGGDYRERLLSSTAGGVGAWSRGRVVQVGIQLDFEAVTRPFEQSPWLRAAVKAVAGGFVQLQPRILDRRPGDEDAQEIELPPLQRLMRRPNAIMSERQLMRAMATLYKLKGDVFLFAQDQAGKPMEVNSAGEWTDVPSQLIPAAGKLVDHLLSDVTGMPEAWRYRTQTTANAGWSPEYPSESVIHLKDFDPEDLVRGVGDGDASMREIDLYHQAHRYLDASVRAGGQPGGVIIYGHRLQEYEIEAREDLLNQTLVGDDSRQFKVLDGENTKFIANPVTPKDMEYRGLLEFLRDVQLAVLGVPIQVIGEGETSTYNNVEAAYKQLWRGPNGILTLAAEIQDTFTESFIRRLGGVFPELRTAYFHLDPANVAELREERTEQVVAAANIAAQRVGVSMNAALSAMGVEEMVEGGDVVLPIGSEAGATTGPADEDPSPPTPSQNLGAAKQEREEISLPASPPPPREEGDPKLAAGALRWLNAYTRAVKRKVRAVANADTRERSGGRLVRRGLDDITDPAEMTENEWRELLLDDVEWVERLSVETSAPLEEIFGRALAAAQAELPGSPILTTSSPRVFRALTGQKIQLTEGVTSRAAQAVRRAILDALATPGGDPALGLSMRQRIKDVLPELTEDLERVFGTKEARAATIAQTETGKAEMTGKYAQWAESGVTEIQWFTSQDNEVRTPHQAIHGERVPLGMSFTNGLRYPLDPLGTAAETINCRCDAVPTKRQAPPLNEDQ